MKPRGLLGEARTALFLEQVRSRIAKNMGVTLQTDYNGVWGQAGASYITMRYVDDSGDHIEVHTKVISVSSLRTDQRQKDLDEEDK